MAPPFGEKRKCRCGVVALTALSVFLCLLFMVAVVLLLLYLYLLKDFGPIAVTQCGKVQGYTHQGVHVFKGIPFALLPTGERRWRPPVAMTNQSEGCWEGTYRATRSRSECPQISPIDGRYSGSEDCLYLDVYTPTLDQSDLRPVLVFIHGGYLQYGNGSIPGYAPDQRIVKKSDMVVVNMQYRLGVFGFMVLDILPNRTGNYGFLDQIEALKWVRDNIKQFGGDPNQVMLYGQSSGGTSVWALMMSPLAKGLFHRAWMISGSPVLNKTISDAARDNEFFKEKTKCYTTQCLYNLSAEEAVQAVQEDWSFALSIDLPQKGKFEKALVVVDGTVIPEVPFDAWDNKAGTYNDVPLIIGTTAQEIDFAPDPPGVPLRNATWKQMEQHVRNRLDPFGQYTSAQALSVYPRLYHPHYVFVSMVSDAKLTCGNNILARKAAAALKSSVYQYVFTGFPSQPIPSRDADYSYKYAFHGIDHFVFHDLLDDYIDSPSEEDIAMGNILRENIFHFIRNGTPVNTEWKPVPDNVAEISKELSTIEVYHERQCEFWERNGLLSYGWIN